MKVKINEKEYEIKELKYLELIEMEGLSSLEVAKKTFTLCAGLTEDEIKDLSSKDGLELQIEINKVNNFKDFQTPTENEQKQN